MNKTDFGRDWTYASGDRESRCVILPHDAMMEDGRKKDAPSGNGEACYLGGIYTYEKNFNVPESWRGKRVVLRFGGVYRSASVYLNGEKIKEHAYGYAPFDVLMSDHLKYGQENELKVTADNEKQPCSRWYPGGGIYRPVTLWVLEENELLPEEIRISTVSLSPAEILVECLNGSHRAEVLDGSRVIAAAEGSRMKIELQNAELWSAENPKLYTLRLAGQEIRFGIRMLSWSPKGFFVNGKETLLRGACIHHDNGVAGAASFPESEWRRIRILKENGFNAVRSAHNPISSDALDACDALGMYVMDEGWDMWYNHKTQFDYASEFRAHYEEDILAMVNRDFNHPSVVMYSIGNEVSEPGKPEGVHMAEILAEKFREQDPSRPVTGGMNLSIIKSASKGKGIYDEENGGMKSNAQDSMGGMNSTMFNMVTSIVGTGMNKAANAPSTDKVVSPVLDTLDICGYNYASGRYPLEGKKHPDRILVGSETFPHTIAKNWAMVEKYPYLIGDFMWTGWDYLGETGVGAWTTEPDGKGFSKPYPWKLADTGALDILGDPTGEIYWAQAAWKLLKQPAVAVRPPVCGKQKLVKMVWRGTNSIPSWSFRGCKDVPVVVEIFTPENSAELFVNGRSAGKKTVKDYRAVFKVKYQEGSLEAAVYDSEGKETGRSRLDSASGSLRLKAEAESAVTGTGVRYVNISICGENGITEANADRELKIRVENGSLIGFGSAQPKTEDEFLTGSYVSYHGRAQAIVLTEPGKMCRISVSGEELGDTVLTLE